MSSISVVVTAFNEEKNIGDCLESVKEFADEIIVIDNSSSDKTSVIAKKFTKKVFIQKNDPGNIDIQKNFGFTKATKNWILSLDADERVPDELESEIKQIIQQDNDSTGYWIPRENIIFGKLIRYTGWYPDYQLRLFKNGKGEYKHKQIHQPLEIQGKTAYLKQPLLHYHYETVSQFINRTIQLYVPIEAEEKLKIGYTFSSMDIIRFPFQEFLSRYFARKGYKDGLHGLALSILMAWYHCMIFLYIWEKKHFIQVEENNILKDFDRESKRMYKEIQYWILTEKIASTKNKGKQYILKLKRKIP